MLVLAILKLARIFVIFYVDNLCLNLNKIGICCFSTKQVALKSKNKDELPRYKDVCPNGAAGLPADFFFFGEPIK